jgi:hypothetical protein
MKTLEASCTNIKIVAPDIAETSIPLGFSAGCDIFDNTAL